MAITTQFLSHCTDEQINKGVAWCMSVSAQKDILWPVFASFAANDYLRDIEKYCTNPGDTMPIAFANEISLMRDWEKSNMYTAIGTRSEMRSLGEYKKPIEITIKNPLRAICEVYILMSVSK